MLFFLSSAYAQKQEKLMQPEPTEVALGDPVVTGISTDLLIRYTILLGERVKSCMVSLFLSMDGGETFYPNPINRALTGDVGRIVTSGEKTIIFTMSDHDLKVLADKQLVFKVSVSKIRIKKDAERVVSFF